MATANASPALGLPTPVGRLEPGTAADVVMLDRAAMMASPYADPTLTAEELVVEMAGREVVDTVLVGGRTVVEAGRPVGIDVGALAGRVRESIERALHGIDEADAEFRALEPYVAAYYRGIDLDALGFNVTGFGIEERVSSLG